MRFVSTAARWFFGNYQLCRIYSMTPENSGASVLLSEDMRPLMGAEELASSTDPSLRELASYGKEGAQGFATFVDGELAAACWYWAGETYKTRNFWPLREGEAKLVEIATAKRFRGRGIAPRLIVYSASRMRQMGYRRLFARVWHSNRASQSAFQKAGWTYIAFLVQIYPLRIRKPFRFVRTIRKRFSKD